MLRFFGETFNKQDCNDCCDNCVNKEPLEEHDVTDEGKNMIQLVNDLTVNGRNLSMTAAVDAFKGSKSSAKQDGGSRWGQGSHLPKEWIEQLASNLVSIGALESKCVATHGKFHSAYLVVSLSVSLCTFMTNEQVGSTAIPEKFVISVRSRPKGNSPKKARRSPSPIQELSLYDESDDGLGSEALYGKLRQARRKVGPIADVRYSGLMTRSWWYNTN